MKRRVPDWIDRPAGRIAASLLALLRHSNPDRASDLGGAVMRRLGPLLRVHRVGERQLRAAFPEQDDAWIAATLRGAWENLGRVVGEYATLDKVWDFDPDHPNTGRIHTDSVPLFAALRDDGEPALCFAAHLANWELPALSAPQHGMASAVVYRMPNNPAVAAEISRIRAPLMGRLIRSRPEAVLEMAAALQAGEHLGMLVDQHFSRGVDVTFFGRRCKANPTIARLAQRFECPVIGVRVIRLPDHRFQVEAVGPLDLPRGADGRIDVPAAMQAITTIVEGWIREHPDQWLWFHRRWR